MKLLLNLLILVILGPHLLLATTYYVGPGGSDGFNGLSLATSFRTLQKAANTVSAGDLVLVSDSTYAGFHHTTSGTAANPIIFKANGTQVIINRRNATTPDGINIEGADWIVIDGFTVIKQPRAGIRAALSNHVTVKNNRCLNNQRWGIFTGFTDDFIAEYNECAFSALEHGIYVSNSSDRAIIRYNTSHDNRAAGLHFNGDISQGGDGINHDPQVYNNIIYQNGLGGGSAINMDGNQNALIYNNLLYENHATGIALYQIDGGGASTGARIYHNTIIQATNSRWGILLVDGASNAIIKNNIILNQHPTRGAINVDPASRTGLVSDYNILTNRFTFDDANTVIDSTGWRGQGYDLHSYFSPNVNNLFTNFSGSDYSLASGSVAINFGTTDITPSIFLDLLNQTRPIGSRPDAGAYESTFAPLPIHWISAAARVNVEEITITGKIEDIENACTISLYKWDDAGEVYRKIDQQKFNFSSSAISVIFKQYPGSGRHRYKMAAMAFESEEIQSKELAVNIAPNAPQLSPNPTNGIVKVAGLKDNASWRIFDAAGRLLQQGFNNVHQIDLSSFTPGSYLVSIISGGFNSFQWVQKF